MKRGGRDCHWEAVSTLCRNALDPVTRTLCGLLTTGRPCKEKPDMQNQQREGSQGFEQMNSAYAGNPQKAGEWSWVRPSSLHLVTGYCTQPALSEHLWAVIRGGRNILFVAFR